MRGYYEAIFLSSRATGVDGPILLAFGDSLRLSGASFRVMLPKWIGFRTEDDEKIVAVKLMLDVVCLLYHEIMKLKFSQFKSKCVNLCRDPNSLTIRDPVETYFMVFVPPVLRVF